MKTHVVEVPGGPRGLLCMLSPSSSTLCSRCVSSNLIQAYVIPDILVFEYLHNIHLSCH
jgi:hypothetical protein